MELKYLYTVKKIIETGSYQKAAAALNYAQSTITFQIKQLENELNVQLFEKNGGRMVLTQAGNELLPLVNQVLDSVESLLSYQDSQEAMRGTLTIALPESLTTYELQPVFKQFKEKAPHVSLSLKVMNCFAIYEQLMGSDIDLAIHYDVGKYPKSVSTGKLRTFPLTLVCSPELPEAERDFQSPNQKKQLCLIQNDKNALYIRIFHQYLREKNISIESQMEVWSIESIKRSVMSNLGIAFLPRFTVEEELNSGRLIEIMTDVSTPEMTAIYAYNKSKWVSPAMELFVKILLDHFTNCSFSNTNQTP